MARESKVPWKAVRAELLARYKPEETRAPQHRTHALRQLARKMTGGLSDSPHWLSPFKRTAKATPEKIDELLKVLDLHPCDLLSRGTVDDGEAMELAVLALRRLPVHKAVELVCSGSPVDPKQKGG